MTGILVEACECYNFTKLRWKSYSQGVHCRQPVSASTLADIGKYVTLS
jgi:hypothetical protein